MFRNRNRLLAWPLREGMQVELQGLVTLEDLYISPEGGAVIQSPMPGSGSLASHCGRLAPAPAARALKP